MILSVHKTLCTPPSSSAFSFPFYNSTSVNNMFALAYVVNIYILSCHYSEVTLF